MCEQIVAGDLGLIYVLVLKISFKLSMAGCFGFGCSTDGAGTWEVGKYFIPPTCMLESTMNTPS